MCLIEKSSVIGGYIIHNCACDQFDFVKIDHSYQTHKAKSGIPENNRLTIGEKCSAIENFYNPLPYALQKLILRD